MGDVMGVAGTMRVVAAVLLCALTAPAGAARDPAAAGRLAVGVTTVDAIDLNRSRTLATEVWYPARSAARDAPMRRGRRLLVIVVHGHCGSRTNYTYLASHLASRGYLVAAPDLPRFCATRDGVDVAEPPRDLAFLHATLHDPTGSLAAVARHVRGVTTALVGHSLGGAAGRTAASRTWTRSSHRTPSRRRRRSSSAMPRPSSTAIFAVAGGRPDAGCARPMTA